MKKYDDYELFDEKYEENVNFDEYFDLEEDPVFEQFFLDEILGW